MKKITLTYWLFFMSIIFLIPKIAISQSDNSTSPASFVLENDEALHCGSDDLKQKLLLEDENYRNLSETFEKHYQNIVKNKTTQNPESMVLHTIPVVVHIIHNNATIGTTANPSDATIQQEINEATERFRHSHPNAGSYPNNQFYGVDTEIEFCIANTDPDGNFTTGIIRHNDGPNSIGNYNTLGPIFDQQYAWDNTNYCNLFIVTDLTNASGVYMGAYDFTIYHASSFWEGLIAHEIGHYLSLAHTFSGGCTNGDCTIDGDLVCDTPPKAQSGMAGGTCAAPGNSCTTDEDDTTTNNPYRPIANQGMGDQPDMLANYMDYTASCWDAFTEGQKTRMKANIIANRQTLISNSVCSSPSTLTNDAGIPFFSDDQVDLCDNAVTITATLKNYGTNTLTSCDIIIFLDGNTAFTYNWTGSLASLAEIDIIISPDLNLSLGTSQINVKTNLPNGVSDTNTANDGILFTEIQYLGNSGCLQYNACQTYNTNTANGPGNITTVTITDNFQAGNINDDIVQICITTEGDVGNSQETFIVSDENGNTVGQTTLGADCNPPPNQVCFYASVSDYNNWITDGSISFDFDPVSTRINPSLCSVNQACVTVYLLQGAPIVADFTANNTLICIGNNIIFTDLSSLAPLSHSWIFTPNTVSFINGTSATSANPEVQFNTSGLYTVSLTVTNSTSNSTETKTDYISVGVNPINSLPYCADVESGTIPTDWVVDDPDGDIGFEVYNISTCAANGNDVVGLQTWAEFPDQTTTDAIITQVIDLTAYDDAQLEFDVAYATTYSNFNTILDVGISTDCGLSYTSLYNKTGGTLSTAFRSASGSSDPNAFFTPSGCSEWRTESIDLEPYSGCEILIRFHASTADIVNSTFGYYWGNNLYLDNFCLTGTACTNFTTLTSSPQTVCNSLVLSADDGPLTPNEIIGWWVTKDNPITNTAISKATTATALASAQVGGQLSTNANVIYNSDGGSPPGVTLNFDCATLSNSNYYATPFISQATQFPTIEFTDCTFGTPVEFTCSCPCPDVDDIADQSVVSSYVLPTITGTNLSGNEAYYSQPNGAGNPIPVGTSITMNSTIYIYDSTPQCNDEESFTVTITNGQSNCSMNLLVVNDPISAGTYSDADSVHSSGTVDPNIGLVNFIGGYDVKLLPGFHANSASNFHAYISACTVPLIIPDDEMEDVLVEKRKEDDKKQNSNEQLQLSISPNPFNQITTIEYYIPEQSNITLTITDLLGKPVKQPERWYSESGWFKKEFDGSHLSGNMYYLILQSENNIISKKILIIK